MTIDFRLFIYEEALFVDSISCWNPDSASIAPFRLAAARAVRQPDAAGFRVEPKHGKSKAALWIVAALLAAGGIAYARWPRSDQSLRAAVIGTWRAEDPDNAALHHRKAAVQSEEAVFDADGRLLYAVQLKSDAKPPAGEPWGWEIIKGKLVLRDLRAGSTQERLAPLHFTIRGTDLSINRKTYPTKIFRRVS